VLVALILIYVVTQLAASLVTAVSGDRNQRILVLVLPIVFVPILINFEAGLLVYWITTNVWTFGQQLAVKKFLPPPEPLSTDDDKATGKDGAGGLRGLLDTLKGASAAGANGASAQVERAPSGKAGAAAATGGGADPSRPPPRAPRKKKKRSGRRR
jgi:YidC/Oxa1 family membrane protein insertase